MDQDFQRLAKEVGLDLGDLAVEKGLGMNQQPEHEVGFELPQMYWLVEHLGAESQHSEQLVEDPTGSRGPHLQEVTCPGLRPALEGFLTAVETAYFGLLIVLVNFLPQSLTD